ncbi:MAG: glycoside hydrolase [Gemmatimonadota bacterium]|nr:glycoside hydrolase [Gemmatimonadota bacterium]
MRTLVPRVTLVVMLGAVASGAAGQSPDLFSAMHWRSIGPPRAGRARALSGVPSQPNVFYIGFDNGGVWRSTDYGSTWEPLFDREPTGSIGAIAVAPSDPNIIYVGSGAGIIRPDLAVGDGVYKSTDGGKSWTHLGLRESQMIAMIDVDPKDPNRLFVAALGHPYGPNVERGIFRSTDGGRSFQKVLYKDEYTSANDVRIDPSDPNTVYGTLWQQQQAFFEGGAFGGSGNGIFKSTDGGTTWRQLGDGLPAVIEANLAIAPSNPRVIYATVAGAAADGGTGRGGAGVVGFYKSTDAGEHWRLAVNDPSAPTNSTPRAPDPRPLVRIGGGDLPTIAVDPKNENVVYSSSTVFWRTDDGGLTWSAVRGAPGGDDYQKTWINPNDPNILLVVSDQGGVVSVNRGASWSNWYNQPTAAMYHVSTDDAFPYRVCGGQQDSGSGCVDSRSMDGEITFHDWHPVNIQEYGIAASDPSDPDMVFGSMRNNVSLYNRKTGQTTYIGPDMTARGAGGASFNRNVRTMPINWSPVDPNILFYVSNAVWKSVDRGNSWTRISPDLARQSWVVPASAGKYASTVTPAPLGTITALSPSPRDVKVLWAGTDDGNIQVTTDGGGTWTNVTPSQIKPWTRIFNMDAGHFDALTAYAAANTFRIDDPNPHFWRTHDGGKSWTEIDNGIAPGAVANSIREDPRKKGLLYASTDTQVWVSFDDGEHWQSLRLDMPAISVRDIQVKDDASCLCSDLVAATHGRGFWILDDVTPLRQAAEAQAARAAYLFKPATAVRVRFATNDPTPWPPELPAGENPPPGAILDYYLAAEASSEVKLDIVDAAGRVTRSYSSRDTVPNPDPALDPAAYTRLCQRDPTAPHCGLPLYWPAPAMAISTRRGMHRVSWDLHHDPIAGAGDASAGDDDATGAVPHRTYPTVNAPWAPPGRYTVRLTVDGKSYTQPLTLRLDPRVKTPAAGLARLATLSREMYDGAHAAHVAYAQARSLVRQLDSLRGSDMDAFKAQVESLAPAPAPAGRAGAARFGRAGAATATPTLDGVSNAMLAAAMAMQGADVTPTANQVAASTRGRVQLRDVLSRWTALRIGGLAALNAKRRGAGQPEVIIPR